MLTATTLLKLILAELRDIKGIELRSMRLLAQIAGDLEEQPRVPTSFHLSVSGTQPE